MFFEFTPNIYTWLLIPLLIFVARVLDVSFGTIRVIFIYHGIRKWAAVCGFIEVLIWLVAIQQIFLNLNNIITYFAYAAGFSIGTYVGMRIEDKLSVGKVFFRAILKKVTPELISSLKSTGYSITMMDAQGQNGKVKMIFSAINRHHVGKFVEIIKKFNPKAFYTIEDVKFVSQEFPLEHHKPFHRLFHLYSKTK